MWKYEKVDFEKINTGDLVQVPRVQFAPMRYGWNGWLFSSAVVIRKGYGKRTKEPVIVVEMMLPKARDDYKTVQRTFYADEVFQTNEAERAKRFCEEYGVSTTEEFYSFIQREDVTGCNEIKFLVDKGFIFD